MTAKPILCAMIGATLGAAAAAQEQAPPPLFDVDTRMGMLCSLALVHTLQAVGRRCFVEPDAPFQAALAEAATRIEAHVLAGSAMTRHDLDGFARSMAGEHQSVAQICGDEARRMYEIARDGGAGRLRAHIDHQVARPGPPEWGACL